MFNIPCPRGCGGTLFIDDYKYNENRGDLSWQGTCPKCERKFSAQTVIRQAITESLNALVSWAARMEAVYQREHIEELDQEILQQLRKLEMPGHDDMHTGFRLALWAFVPDFVDEYITNLRMAGDIGIMVCDPELGDLAAGAYILGMMMGITFGRISKEKLGPNIPPWPGS